MFNTAALKTTALYFAFFVTSFAFSQSYIYQLEVNENDLFHPKELIDYIREDITCSNMRYFSHSEFLFQSPNNVEESYFDNLMTTLGLELIHFQKTKTTHTVQNAEKAGGPDCESSELLCSNTSVSANSSGSGTLQELNGSNRGCLTVEHQSSWYYINIGTSGDLNMTIDPANNGDDYDFAIWGPFTDATAGANCPPVSNPIRCSYSSEEDQTGMGQVWGAVSSYPCCPCFFGIPLSTCYNYGWITATDASEGPGGDSWVAPLDVTAGQVYILLVDNFSNSGQPYNLSWGGSAVLNCVPVVLPIELASFSASAGVRQNILQWETLTELNNDYFRIERSTDGIVWETIGEVDGAGQTSESHQYVFKDVDFPYEMNYYRLKQVDFDGTAKYSTIVNVDNSLASKTVLKTINTMGQEVGADYAGMKIIMYTDGTILKVGN